MKEVQHKDIILLLGFESDINEFKLSNEIIIRKGTKQELEKFQESIPYGNIKTQKFILQYEYEQSSGGTFPEKLFKTIDNLNLFFAIFLDGTPKVTYAQRFIKLDNKYLSAGFVSNPRVSTYFSSSYFLSVYEIEKMKNQWELFLHQSQFSEIQIALRRFLFSIQKHEQEDQFIDLMIAFEALLTKERENFISKNISVRCSKLLSDTYEQKDVIEFMKSAYKLRSQIVHGSNYELINLTSKERYFSMESKIDTLSKFMRSCLQKKILLYSKVKCSNFIDIIDSI